MKITFLGAADTVTGSKHVVEFGGRRILLDCGMFQGRRDKTTDYNTHLAFDPKTVDVLLLSHAHIDHCGRLPLLRKRGFRGPIYATPACRDLARILARLQNRLRNPRELGGIRDTLRSLPPLREELQALPGGTLAALAARIETEPALLTRLEAALGDELPVDLTEGGALRAGFDAPELVLDGVVNGLIIAQLEMQERVMLHRAPVAAIDRVAA